MNFTDTMDPQITLLRSIRRVYPFKYRKPNIYNIPENSEIDFWTKLYNIKEIRRDNKKRTRKEIWDTYGDGFELIGLFVVLGVISIIFILVL